MYCLYVCACTALGSYKRLSQPPHPLQLELQTTVRNQTLATSTTPFLIIVFWIALIGKQIMFNSKSWGRICSVINVLSNSILHHAFSPLLSIRACTQRLARLLQDVDYAKQYLCITAETLTKNKPFPLHETEAMNFVSFL